MAQPHRGTLAKGSPAVLRSKGAWNATPALEEKHRISSSAGDDKGFSLPPRRLLQKAGENFGTGSW